MANSPDIDTLAERILRGDLPRFEAGELDAVLSWVSGSERLGAGELIRRLGTVRERPDLMRQVYAHLEAELFVDGRLDAVRAHVHDGIDDRSRRARFRRLMTAFHPDRYPEDAEWMTPRAQAIYAAWRQFRRGETETADATPTSPTPQHQRKSHRPTKDKWPVERKSARLTPETTPVLTRLRRRIAGIEHLQGKVLTGLALLAFVPVAWMYFAYQPYRAVPAADEILPLDEEATEPLAIRAIETPAAIDQPVPGQPTAASIPELSLEAEQAVGELPGQLPIWDNEWARMTEGAEDLELEPDLGETERLALATPEPLPPIEPPEPETESVAHQAEPAAAPAESTPDQGDVQPAPAADPEREPDERQKDHPPDPAPDTPAEASDDAVEPEIVLATVDPTVPDTDQPQPGELIGELLDAYQSSFERGELDNFMALFTASPRENRNEGRDWFRDNYHWLFTESEQRRLELDILDIESSDGYWLVTASFTLQVNWPDRRPVHDRREVRYTVRDINDGRLRIAAIDY